MRSADTGARLQVFEQRFPGSDMMTPKFPRAWIEMVPDKSCGGLDAVVTPRRARHTPETNPTEVSVEIGGKVVAYTGDTEWTAPGD